MRQLLQNLRTGETLVAEVPIPKPRVGTALVRTYASLVSAGTERMVVDFASKSLIDKARSRPDLVKQVIDKTRREGLITSIEAVFNRLDQPLTLGYSSAGRIVALGNEMQGFQVGQRVACAGGGYAVHAEYALVPKNLMAVLPETVKFEPAAFTTLGAIALHGLRLSQAAIGDRVAVIGLGLLGLLSTAIARAAGCQVLGIDLDPERVKLADRMGASLAVSRQEAQAAAQSFSLGRGCDVVLICADTPSADPVELAGEISRDRARVVAVGAIGLQLPRKVYYEKELSFINSRSYGPGRYDPTYEEQGRDYPIGFVRWTEGRNLEAFVDLLDSGQVDVQPLITHRFPIDRAPEAYDLITGKVKQPFLGVLLTYGDEESEEAEQQPWATKVPIRSVEYTQRPSPSTVRLGVLGAGNFATAVLLPALRNIKEIELVGIASGSGFSAQNAATRYGFSYATSDEDQIIQDTAINTIAVLTRHNHHSRQVIASLSCGKNVFCEKPLALTIEEVGDIAASLNAQNQEHPATGGDTGHYQSPSPSPILMVGFNRRFAPLARRLQEFLKDRQEPLLAQYRVNAGYLPPTHWLHDPEQGGGRIIGEGCHFIDFLTFLVGDLPVEVNSRGLPDTGRYREDNVVMNVTFKDGSLGVIEYLANGDKAFPKERVEVFTAGKVAVLDDFRSLEMFNNGQRDMIRSRFRQDKGHRSAWQAFSTAILGNSPPPIPYTHIFGVTLASFAALESLHCGKSFPITLNMSGS